MYVNFLRYRKIYYIFSGILIGGSILSLIVFGLNFGIEFTGGSLLELEYIEARPSNQDINQSLSDLDLGSLSTQPTDEKGVILRMRDIDEKTHQEVIQKLSKDGEIAIEEKRFESIGPVVGQELKDKIKVVIVVALISIVLYIAFAFRKVQRPVSSFRYGIVTLIALFHDVLIPLGVLSILGRYYDFQVTIPLIAALLAILGYSVNDTVIVFDRIRENLLKRVGVSFEDTVNKSLNQTLSRSINTSFTTLLVVFAIFFFGGYTLKDFSLIMIIGISAGAYSSIFIASPLLVSWHQKSI
ncbi:MAG: protein translocase subunit SecF [Parcubacteria group bacterium]|jgi:preprotein translocase subunit SecF|nr:protein translocase subunit SecF [Parcubacteria group bacterium]|tara:strand:- start:23546 stop:24439 length:894 start_codon:yes stop_codon:yes gene_type:complete